MKRKSTTMAQTCLVTGGAGFIGSHLCDALIKRGYEVYCVDNLLTGSLANIRHLNGNPSFHFLEHDVRQTLVKPPEVPFIYHLASPASPVWYQRYPLETLLANTYGTYQLLEIAVKQKAKFLFTSTSEVYGEPSEHPQKETYNGNVSTTGPRSCYDESKRCGEAFVNTYIKKFSLDARIIRIFNTYGPRMQADDGRVISNFITQVLTDQPVTIYGEGRQTRSFCYVSDMVEGLILAMESSACSGEILNIGNDNEITIKEIAEIIAQKSGKKPRFTYSPLPKGDPSRRRPDISKVKNILGWSPRISIEEGISRTVNYMEKCL